MGERNTIINSALDLTDYEIAKPFIRSCLTNESNLRARQVKTLVCADVWKTYFVELPSPKGQRTVCFIGAELLACWNRTIDDLDTAAAENERKTDLIVDMSELFGGSSENFRMYLITNLDGWNGASEILNKSVQTQLADLFPEGYAILPSSVHEVIAIPISAAHGAEVIVKTMNATYMVPKRDLLSDHVFHVEDGKLSLLEQEC